MAYTIYLLGYYQTGNKVFEGLPEMNKRIYIYNSHIFLPFIFTYLVSYQHLKIDTLINLILIAIQ